MLHTGRKARFYLLVLPALLAVTAVFLNNARGPYWLGTNLDPEYVYLLNAGNLAGFKGVGHIDHPGTPVQALGAVVIRTVHLFSSTPDDLHTDVIKRPEHYLNAIGAVMIVSNVFMLLLLGIVAYTLTRSIWAGLWFQSAPFFSIVVLKSGLTRVTPEPLLFLSAMAMVCVILFIAQERENASSKRILFVSAVITGFGVACKITFLPVMVIPFIALSGIKNKLYYLAASGAAFVVFTLPIIRMYNRFFQWIYLLLTHTGHYGGGASGLITAGRFIDNIKQLLSHNLFFSIALFLGLSVVTAALLIPKLRKPSLTRSNSHFKLLAASTMAQAVGILMVSKHSADHYLMPVLNLSGVVLFLVYSYLKSIRGIINFDMKRLVISSAAVAVFLLILFNPPQQVKTAVEGLTRVKEKSLALRREVEDNYKDYAKIYYYTGSSPEYALKFGDDLSRSYHSEVLERVYKNVYFYDIWTQRFTRFDYNRGVGIEEIRAKYGKKIIFQGTRGIKIPGLKLEKVFDVKSGEGIYKLYAK